MNIKGQTVIITGGASGMGAATVKHLYDLGAKIAVFDRDKTSLDAFAQKTNMLPVHCDVTNADSVAEAFEIVKRKLGIARICISCAGIVSGEKIVSKDQSPMPLDNFAQVINVNLIGTFNILRVAAAEMSTLDPLEDNERGIIINTASVAAYEGQIGQAAYAASKGGVVALTLPAARELAQHGIRVMTIAPGLIETPMLQGLPDNVKDALIATVPFPKRFGKAAEFSLLAQQIIENTMLNGSVIRLDGALRMAAR